MIRQVFGIAIMLCVARVAIADAPHDIVDRDVVLAQDSVDVSATIESNLSLRYVNAPWSIAPDVYIGANQWLTVGITTSARALSELDLGLGGIYGVCMASVAHGCKQVYDNLAFDARAKLRSGAFAVALRMRAVMSSFEPERPSVRIGALLRWHSGRFGIVADPQWQIGLDHRDLGNRDWLRVPVWISVQPLAHVALSLRTGIEGEFATFEDTYVIPVAVQIEAAIGPHLSLAVVAGYPSLLGPQNSVDNRMGELTATVRF